MYNLQPANCRLGTGDWRLEISNFFVFFGKIFNAEIRNPQYSRKITKGGTPDYIDFSGRMESRFLPLILQPLSGLAVSNAEIFLLSYCNY
uniref:Uncharacterized protein n=1 Tax=Kuenenia stuttgartiensis TaxID=174633 RepID=Q1PYV3_KUEST|nr:unknown protein [Candidatus Kuenenia stuttgartiensis]